MYKQNFYFIEIFILAVGLSMDAFAVAICKGLSVKQLKLKHAIIVGLYFGGFQAFMPLLGYCYGAGETKRLKEINRWSFILLGCYAALCIVVVMTFADTLVRLFINEPATVEKGVRFLRIWFFCAPGMCFTNLFSSIFQAMGKWIHSLVLSVIRFLTFPSC